MLDASIPLTTNEYDEWGNPAQRQYYDYMLSYSPYDQIKRQAYPAMFKAYEKACAAGEVRLGKMYVFDLGGLVGGPRWIIHFPTTGHWRSRSRLADIDAGLADLVEQIRCLGIRSIAVPPLGCGHGGLNWVEVYPRIEAALAALPDVKVALYPPLGAPLAEDMPIRTEKPAMTEGRAALLAGLLGLFREGNAAINGLTERRQSEDPK